MANSFWQGWDAQDTQNRQRESLGMQRAVTQMGLLQKIQAQQQAAKVNEILTSSPDAATAMDRLRKEGGAAGLEAIQKLGMAEKQGMELGQMRREQAVFSPQNIAANTTPGRPARAEIPAGIDGGPGAPAEAAVAPQVNEGALRQQSMMTSPAAFERGSAHIAGEKNREATIAATKESALSRVAQQRDSANQLHETRLSRLSNDADRQAEVARHNKVSEMLMGQSAALNADVRRQGLEMRAMQFRQQGDQQNQRSVMQLGAALEKANLPESDAVLGAVEKAVSENANLAEYISGPKSLLPDFSVPAEIRAGRQAFQKLFNITLKNRSGAAVTIPEFERLKAEFGSGTFKTKDQIDNALTQARNIINNHYASVASGYSQTALDAYNENIRQFGGSVVLGGAKRRASDTAGLPDASAIDAELARRKAASGG